MTLVATLAMLGLVAGCSSSNSTSGGTTATPTFTPSGGTFSSSQTVTVGDVTTGAVLYCTEDGSTPTTSSPVCAEPITVAKSETLSAIAVAPGFSDSTVAKAAFTISLNPIATPVISPGGGTFVSVQTVTISESTSGATILYTTDGTNPASSTTAVKYTAPITVASSETINAVATVGTGTSAEASAVFAINLPSVPTPVISPAGGSYTTTQSVTITDANTNATIYYTVDGSTPTSASTKYSGAITVSTSETINAIATLNGEASSQVATAAFTLTGTGPSQMLPDPVITPNGGSFSSVPQVVTITDANASALIYYTLDGSTPPSATSILYTKPINLENAGAINAVAIASGYLNSNVVTANFAFSLTPAATPVLSLPNGNYTSAQQLTITDSTPGASIYYCTAATGQTCIPTINSMLYGGAITVDASEVIEAIAAAPGFNNSAAAVGTYTLDLPAVLTPIISPSSFFVPQLVTLTDYVSGATIYYTTDGSVPTTASTKYTVPFSVSALTASNGTETVNAIATAPQFAQSAVASVTYTVQTPVPSTTVPGGTFVAPFSVGLTDALPNATIYYTTDGSTPSTSSTQYTGPIAITGSQAAITAIAVAPNYAISQPSVTTEYSLIAGSATEPAPTFKVDSGTAGTSLNVEIDDTDPNAFIFYNVTGGTTGLPPTEASSIFTPIAQGGVPITIAATQTVEAFAISANQTKYSSVSKQTFTITAPEPPPVLPAGGTVTTPVDIAGTTDADSTATIYYTVDGSQPSATNGANLTAGADVVLSAGTTTVNAIAISATGVASTVATATYTVNLPITPTPTLSLPTGTYAGAQTITVTDTDSSASLIYSTDMMTWTQVPPLGIPVTASETLFVIAQDQPRNLDSAVASATYTLTLPVTATPTFTPAPGTYSSTQSVSIGDDTPGSTIYYTTDGSTPTTSSAVYSVPLSVTATETIKALAAGASGYEPSAVATGVYTIQAGNTLSLTGTVTSAGSALDGAAVTLYAAGTTGYGSASTSLATATSASGGAFSVSFTCPAAPGDQLYLVASSGFVRLMAGLGSCANFSSSSPPAYVVNEATTIASAYALSGFMVASTGGGVTVGAPTTNFNATTKLCPVTAVGNSGCNYTGLANAFNTIPNLVDLTTGDVLTITPYYAAAGGTSGGSLNSSYVPQARIDTLANILAACGSSSSECATLFTAATPPSGTAPSSSVQAALDIALHPGNNVATLYGLSSVSKPFTPSLTSAPTDWTLALTFTGGGLGWPTGTGLNPSNAPEPIGLAVDSLGNLWMNANNGAFYAVVQFNNQGEPLSPNLSGDFAAGISRVTGGYQNNATTNVGKSNVLAIDQSDQVWVASSSESGAGYLAALNAAGTPVVQNTENAYAAESSVQGLAVDKVGNLLETYSSECDLESYNATDGAALLSESVCTGNTSLTLYEQVAFDPSGNIWTISTTGTPSSGALAELGPVDSSPVDQLQLFTNGADYSLAIDGSGNVFAPTETSPGTITKQNQSSAQSTDYTYPLPSGAEGVTAVALDGVGHVWGAAFSGSATADPTVPSYLIEMTNTGTLLSPQGSGLYGYTGTGGGGETQAILADYRKGISGIAVDGSGNVWVTNVSPPNTNFSHVAVGEQLVEFIGIATPVVTPTSVALTNNALASKP